jgi:hypothetical protein
MSIPDIVKDAKRYSSQELNSGKYVLNVIKELFTMSIIDYFQSIKQNEIKTNYLKRLFYDWNYQKDFFLQAHFIKDGEKVFWKKTSFIEEDYGQSGSMLNINARSILSSEICLDIELKKGDIQSLIDFCWYIKPLLNLDLHYDFSVICVQSRAGVHIHAFNQYLSRLYPKSRHKVRVEFILKMQSKLDMFMLNYYPDTECWIDRQLISESVMINIEKAIHYKTGKLMKVIYEDSALT